MQVKITQVNQEVNKKSAKSNIFKATRYKKGSKEAWPPNAGSNSLSSPLIEVEEIEAHSWGFNGVQNKHRLQQHYNYWRTFDLQSNTTSEGKSKTTFLARGYYPGLFPLRQILEASKCKLTLQSLLNTFCVLEKWENRKKLKWKKRAEKRTEKYEQ